MNKLELLFMVSIILDTKQYTKYKYVRISDQSSFKILYVMCTYVYSYHPKIAFI